MFINPPWSVGCVNTTYSVCVPCGGLLIGADTVDTIPPATFDAFREHGKLRASLTEDVPGAARHMENLAKAGISMKEVTQQLVVDGVRLFAEAFKTLLDATGKSAGVKA